MRYWGDSPETEIKERKIKQNSKNSPEFIIFSRKIEMFNFNESFRIFTDFAGIESNDNWIVFYSTLESLFHNSWIPELYGSHFKMDAML